MKPLISVIVPVYNLETNIERCVESILQQTYQSLEIIVVDDGSTDNSRSIISALAQKDARINPIIKENGGVTSARLEGVKHAKGDWIGFVDGDDEVDPEMYEHLLDNAVHYKADISHCGYQIVFADGRIRYFYNSGELIVQGRDDSIDALLLGEKIEPSLCNKLFRRSLFTKILSDSLMDLSIKNNEDLLMNFYLFNSSKTVVFEDWCPYHYIVRDNSASRGKNSKKKINDAIRVREIILEECASENKACAEVAFLNTCVYAYCSLTAKRGYSEIKKEIRRKIISHNANIKQLHARTRTMAKLIVYLPGVLEVLYPIYRKYFQKQKYS